MTTAQLPQQNSDHLAALPTSLDAWLNLLETRHAKHIDLGLDRVEKVRQRLAIKFGCPVIMVAGTNGKGSTCSMLESILLQAGYRVGLYIKPHFLKFNERARIAGQSASDEQLMHSFAAVEAARIGATSQEEISLSYFEFTTLAIMHLLQHTALDVVILEVGLGGRLDAVNVIDADVAIVTSIDIDHAQYLGDTREKVGYEKAGIFRSGKAAICSDPLPPRSLIDHAQAVRSDLWLLGRDFNYSGDQQQWNFGGRSVRRNALSYPSLRGANQLLNASAALAALEVLRMELPVSAQEVRTGLVTVELPARFQVLPGRPTIVLDVAHNPHAAATLAQNFDNMGFYPYTHAVFGIMQDKDIDGVISQMKGCIDHWYVTDLDSERAATAVQLRERLIAAGIVASEEADAQCTIQCFSSPEEAFAAAKSRAGENDRIAVFGSFHTVAGVMRARHTELH